ncbi:MAG: Divalent ion tolerance protein [Pseudomonadota bacterium]|jgi:periplasmic divalent cation tolerance protein
MSIIISLVACPSQEVASMLAKLLVDQHLAACAQILPPMQSVYRWKGEVCIDQEVLLIIKTTSDLKDEVHKAIEANHPYEVPECIAIEPTAVSEKYAAWLMQNVRKS